MHRVLEGIVRNGRIASAYIFVGPDADGKKQEALEFTDQLGCRGVDRITVQPLGASFKIEQVRELQQLVRYGPSVSPFQCVIIEGADSLTDDAAGAFLKTLEEPPEKVVFILLVEREDRIPATIDSRCQKVIFPEKSAGWQPNAEFAGYYEAVRQIAKRGPLERMELSNRLGSEKERIEDLLYDLAAFARQELRDVRVVRGLLEGVKNVKKKANLRLTLDVMCLKLGRT